MQEKLIKLFTELGDLLGRSTAFVLLLIGFAGAGARLMVDGNKKHTAGQRFVIMLMGGISSVLVGMLLQSIKPDSVPLLTLTGFICGMFGYSTMKYVIDNEQAAFHTTAQALSKLIDVIVKRVADLIVPKKSEDLPTNETSNDETNKE